MIEILTADSGVAALVEDRVHAYVIPQNGDGARVYPEEAARWPAVTVALDNDPNSYTVSGQRLGTKISQISGECMAEDYVEARDVAIACRDAVEAAQGTVVTVTSDDATVPDETYQICMIHFVTGDGDYALPDDASDTGIFIQNFDLQVIYNAL